MELPNITQIDKITISFEPINFTKEDIDTVATILSNPSFKKYLKHLEQDIASSHYKVPLQDFVRGEKEFAIKQAFVKGMLNVTQTLLNFTKT